MFLRRIKQWFLFTHRQTHTRDYLKLLHTLRCSAWKSGQSAASLPWTQVFAAVKRPVSSPQSILFCRMRSTSSEEPHNTNTTSIHTYVHAHTHSLTYAQALWWRLRMLPTPCCVRNDVPGVGTGRGASSSAIWASLPAPDNFTIPALAGGDNHIKLPWQEALNSAPVPLRVWHPADSAERATDVTMSRFVFSFFHSLASLLCFVLLFLSPKCIWVSLGQKSELAESSVTTFALSEMLLYYCLLFVMVNSI